MNGFEAIEFMKNGGMVDSKFYFPRKIVEGVMYYKPGTGLWSKCDSFDVNFDEWFEYKEPKALTGWERTEDISDTFYYIGTEFVAPHPNNTLSFYDGAYNKANAFSTKEKAEEINFKQTLFRKLQRFSDENGGSEIDWNNVDQYKFFIYYVDDEIRVDYVRTVKNFGQVYFYTRDIAERAVELFNDDLIKHFTM